MEIGGYRAEKLLGQGASASVYRAVAPNGKAVALKVFDGPYQRALDAAKKEAALWAQVDHPHLARIHALVCDADQIALAVELGAAGSLSELLARRHRLTPPEVLTVIIPVASALATAHERGVVHGDLSPANIVFDAAGRPILTDLGAARVAIECGLPVCATPGYVAPEVAKGSLPDAAADVFALGAVALHCLSGRPAWNADDLRDVVVQSTVGQWPDPDDADGPRAMLAAVRSALGDAPDRRPGAASLVMELSRCGTPEPIDLSMPAATADPAAGGSRRPKHEAQHSDRNLGDDAAESIPPQRIRLAATRLRGDAVRPEPEPDHHHRHDRRWWYRTAAGALLLAVIGTVAIQAGLMWADTGTRTGATPPAASASSAASPSRLTVTSTVPSSRATLSTARSSRATSPTASPALPTAPATRGSAAPSATPQRSTAAARPSANPQRRSAAAGTPASATDAWLTVVRQLDAARADALVRRDTRRLTAVYTTGAGAMTDDATTIAALVANGFRVAGAAHRIVGATVVKQGDIVEVAVTDSLPSYRVLDANDVVVGTTKARAVTTRLLDLVKTAGGYRIAAVTTA